MASILIAEDSDTQRESIKKIIEHLGYQAICAKNGEEAYSLACQFIPKLILMDVVMPESNGYQAIRLLKKDGRTKNIPVAVVSTKNSPSDIAWGLKQGADEYLAKPFSPSDLSKLIQKMI